MPTWTSPGDRLFLRFGKQNLAWGETDVFRLLDQINPLDNTFGGPFEDLDDRRIPLWMLRGSYNLGVLGPIDSLTLEGFWVPGDLGRSCLPAVPLRDGLFGSVAAPAAPVAATDELSGKGPCRTAAGGCA